MLPEPAGRPRASLINDHPPTRLALGGGFNKMNKQQRRARPCVMRKQNKKDDDENPDYEMMMDEPDFQVAKAHG